MKHVDVVTFRSNHFAHILFSFYKVRQELTHWLEKSGVKTHKFIKVSKSCWNKHVSFNVLSVSMENLFSFFK